MLCPMNHREEKWCFTVAICARMKLAQILLAMLNRFTEQWDCADFAPFSMQIRNRVFCVKAQIVNFHIEKFTAPGCGIIHEDHEHKIPQVFLFERIGLLKQCNQRRFGQKFNNPPMRFLGGNIAGRKI